MDTPAPEQGKSDDASAGASASTHSGETFGVPVRGVRVSRPASAETTDETRDTPPTVSLPPMPPFFGGSVPASFCGVFAQAATAPIYWQLLSRLYVATFESDRVRVLKEEALEFARSAWVENCAQGTDDEALAVTIGTATDDGESADQRSLSIELASARSAFDRELAMARYLLGRCYRAGWVHYEYQREFNADAVHFTPAAARTLDTWLREARDEQPPLQGYLLNVRGLLQPATLRERPHVAIVTAQRALREFTRELLVLSQDIARSIDRVLQDAATPQAVLEEAMDRYGRRVSANYHRIKTVENIHRVRVELLQRVDALAQDVVTIDAAATAWVEREGLDVATAAEKIKAAVMDMRERLQLLPALLADLDERNAKFSGAAWRQLIYLLHQDAQLEAKLEGALRALYEGAEEDGIALEVYRFRGLAHHSEEAAPGDVGTDAGITDALGPNDAGPTMSTAFLYRPSAPPVVTTPEPVQTGAGVLSADSAQRLAERLANALTPDKLDAIALAVLGDAPARAMRDITIASEREYIRTVVALGWARRGEGSVRFERLTCRPTAATETVCGDLHCPQCRHRSGPYVLPNGVLVRTAAGRRLKATTAAAPAPPPTAAGIPRGLPLFDTPA